MKLQKYNIGIIKNGEVFMVSRFAMNFESNEFFYHFIYGKNLTGSGTYFKFINRKDPNDSYIKYQSAMVDHLSYHRDGKVHAKFKNEKKKKYLTMNLIHTGIFSIKEVGAVTSPLIHQITFDSKALLLAKKSEIYQKNSQIEFQTKDHSSFSILFFVGERNLNIPLVIASTGLVSKMKIISDPVTLAAPNNKSLVLCLCQRGLPNDPGQTSEKQVLPHRYETYPQLMIDY